MECSVRGVWTLPHVLMHSVHRSLLVLMYWLTSDVASWTCPLHVRSSSDPARYSCCLMSSLALFIHTFIYRLHEPA